MDLSDYLYVINDNEGHNIVYCPIKGVASEVNEYAAKLVNQYINREIKLEDNNTLLDFVTNIYNQPSLEIVNPTINVKNRAIIILSQRCNLACSYCFAHDSHSDVIMKWETLKSVIDHIFATRDDKKVFDFIGGGEPLFEWDLLCRAISYIHSVQGNVNTIIRITTNATLLSEERIIWLKNNDVKVSISCDILPSIQNSQRPFLNNTESFSKVNQSIISLLSHDFSFRIRSTISKSCVELMPEMVEFVRTNYQGIKTLHFEPVSGNDISYENYYSKFIPSFFKAKILATKYGIDLRSSITNSAKRIHSRFCKGEQCFTPEGHIVACHRVSSANCNLFNHFSFGNATPQGVTISEQRKKHIENDNVYNNRRCSSCFAKWTCAGGCRYNQLTYSNQQKNDECRFIKEMLAKELYFQLSR